ncbi:hypothetical protein [Turicibacter sanguinis]|uniref:hypothetical protein n=1 Tax=Turicibacter sanguinis TaxID=154288 RepID=UPI0021D4C6D7|nr:hypothetical protein [Turicibacter sanguinis]MCU7197987.1 hypothetical protein [Turicibacter sanguinis]MDB8576084.1 hypothetical protein [Turicibacter sanguinis]MDB8578889.1 hypothetical protein [Turicibacter sanguinis]MDB8584702.1 hypothetical protein [Turicibacter sanguinis]MDB8587649.1 hypothetical protein [Turicibacter sanguinis]
MKGVYLGENKSLKKINLFENTIKLKPKQNLRIGKSGVGKEVKILNIASKIC